MVCKQFIFFLFCIWTSLSAWAQPLRIGVYSGSFDPPHIGHKNLVEDARKQLGLDLIIIVPVLTNVEKLNATPYPIRKKMAAIAFGDSPFIQLPDAKMEAAFLESRISGVIHLLQSKYPGSQLFQIMGIDAFERYQKIPEFKRNKNVEIIVGDRGTNEKPLTDNSSVHFIQNIEDTSSTEMKKLITAGDQPSKVDSRVLAFSQQNNLYSNSLLPYELLPTSEMVQKIQDLVKTEFGISTVYIGGGSARAVLDHILMGKPVSMRDLDVFMTMGRKVERSDLEKLGKKIEALGIGQVQWSELQARVRSNKQLPMPEKLNYVTGYGFSVKCPGMADLDLSIYHTLPDLLLNGAFNIDQVLVPLEEPLVEQAKKLRSYTVPRLIQEGYLLDRNHGYLTWVEGDKPKVVNWDEIAVDTGANMIRAVRGFYKMANKGLSDEFRTQAKELITTFPPKDKRRLIRNIVKLLEDKTAASELKDLADIGLIKQWSPELSSKINSLSQEQLNKIFTDSKPISPAKVSEVGLGRLLDLVDTLASQPREIIYDDIKLLEPDAIERKRKVKSCSAFYERLSYVK